VPKKEISVVIYLEKRHSVLYQSIKQQLSQPTSIKHFLSARNRELWVAGEEEIHGLVPENRPCPLSLLNELKLQVILSKLIAVTK
jgi:hypothetical protein